MKGMNLTKAQVARRQLGTALKLFLDDLDPVSVHALACAGGEIAEHLTRKRGQQPFSRHAMATFRDLAAKKIRHLRNQFWNAFKHAVTHKGEERDDRKLLERFNDQQNDHALFVGWYDYAMAAKPLPLGHTDSTLCSSIPIKSALCRCVSVPAPLGLLFFVPPHLGERRAW